MRCQERAEQAQREDGKPHAGGPGRLTHAERVIDPASGLTKGDLARYYVQPPADETVSEGPAGLAGARAVGHRRGPVFPAPHGCRDARRASVAGVPVSGASALLELPTPRAVLAAVQMNAIEFHTWNAVKTAIDKPDRIVFDLDPGEGVPWENVGQAARVLRALLSEIGLDAWLKTSGGKGLHVLVPLRRQHGWETTKDFSAALVRHLAQAWPQLFVAKSGPRNRVGRIYADYLRNGFGATTVAPWSAGAAGPADLGADQLGRTGAGARRRTGPSRTRGSDWISAIVPGMGMRRRPGQGHGGAWFASVVKARRRARGRRQAGPRQGASDFFIEGAGCRT